jgi:hypothetical protein
MPKCKPHHKRVCGDIPEDLHKKIMEYNKTAAQPVNFNRLINQACSKIVEEIETVKDLKSKGYF